ncbi:MAG: hypothetical protein Q7K54_03745 [Candidatus Parcubacteria bacterium]|nr:hypothetical protein [Candidatus Parcubacteria bacterium]
MKIAQIQISRVVPTTDGISKIIPPLGGRICREINIQVRSGQLSREMVMAAGPDTPEDSSIFRMNFQAPTSGGESLILLNYRNGGSLSQALVWAMGFYLERTNPIHILSMGMKYRGFHHQVRMDPTCVVNTEDFFSNHEAQVCKIYWYHTKRKVCLESIPRCESPGVWFAFIDKSEYRLKR